jgi:hypothetical protein
MTLRAIGIHWATKLHKSPTRDPSMVLCAGTHLVLLEHPDLVLLHVQHASALRDERGREPARFAQRAAN